MLGEARKLRVLLGPREDRSVALRESTPALPLERTRDNSGSAAFAATANQSIDELDEIVR